MAVSKSQQRAVHKYVKANYDRLELTVPKGRKEIIKAAAEAQGTSINNYINTAVDEKMERDSTKPPVSPSEAVTAHLEAGAVSLPADSTEAAQSPPEPKKRGRKRKDPTPGDIG